LIEDQKSFDAETSSVVDLEKTIRASGMDELLNHEAVESDDRHLLRKARDDA